MDTLIAILGGAIWNDDGVWKTSSHDHIGDDHGITNDRFRVLASVYLYQKNPAHTTLLAQGGLAKGVRPSIASVIKGELKVLGVSEAHILLEERSFSTYSQLLELQSLATEKSAMDIFIVSNEWHLPRIETMISWIPELHELSLLKPQFYAAEDILLQEGEKEWRAIIEVTRQREDMITRVLKEQQGVEQIRAGTYKYR